MPSLWFRKKAIQRITLSGSTRPAWHVARHRALRDIEPELKQLTVDARCAPSILPHQADKATNLGIDSRSTRAAASLRDLRPVAPKTLAVPLRDRVGINYDEATRPSWPRGSQRHPESAVNIVEQGTRPLALECANMLTEGEILGQEFRAGEKEGPNGPGTEGYEENNWPEHDAPVCPQIRLNSSPMGRRLQSPLPAA